MRHRQAFSKRLRGTLPPWGPCTQPNQSSHGVWRSDGIRQAHAVPLRPLGTALPVGRRKTAARLPTVRCGRSHPQTDSGPFYPPLRIQVLADWRSGAARVLCAGRQGFGDRGQFCRWSVRHGNRVMPLAWTVLPGRGFARVEKLEARRRPVAAGWDGRV